MGKESAPAAPNPYQSAQAQYQYGTQAAAYNKALNSTDVSGPTGSTSYNITGYDPTTGAPIYTQTNTLTAPEQQMLGEGQQATITAGQEAQGALGQKLPSNVAPTPVQGQINTSGVSAIPGAGNLAGFTDEAQNAAYSTGEMYLQPQIQQQQQALDTQLRNSGAQPGSEAYNNAMEDFNLQVQQEQTGVENNAVTQGLQEQQALYGEGANTNQQEFGEAATEQQAANAAAGQQFGESEQSLASGIQLQQLPLQEYESLASGSQLPSFGLGGGQGQVSAPDIMSAFNNQYQGQLAQYNAGVASQNADIGAAASIAAMALMA